MKELTKTQFLHAYNSIKHCLPQIEMIMMI